MTEVNSNTVELGSLEDLAAYLNDETPAPVAEEAPEQEVEEVEELEQEEESEEEEVSAAEEEQPKKKRTIYDEVKDLRKERREERERAAAAEQKAAIAEEQARLAQEAYRKMLAALEKPETKEEQDEPIDAEHINPLKAEVAQLKLENALEKSHNSGVASFGNEYNVARQYVLAAEICAIKDELEPAEINASFEEIKQLAEQRIARREITLLQQGKSVAKYTWNRGNRIAAQFQPSEPSEPKEPKKPKINIAEINKAREQAELAPVKRQASNGTQAGSIEDYNKIFAAEDAQMRGYI